MSNNNKKNYKLLNSNKRNNNNRITNIQREESEEDINDDYDEPLELLPCREEEDDEDNRIQITTSSNDEEEDEEEEENSLATSTTTLFRKIKDNISSSFRKMKDEEKEEQTDLEEQDEESNIDYSYYTDNPNNGSGSGNNGSTESSPPTNQVPLYSINSTPAWFIRSNDPYSLENHIINHMRSNSRIDVLQQQATQAAAPPTNNNTVQEHITSDGAFRPFSSHFINEQHQLSEQQDNLIKEKDIVIIQQPNNRISIGFSDSKFNSYLKTGEHNPSGFYNSFIQNDQMIQRLALLTSPELAGANGGILGDSGSEYSDFGIYRLSQFELEKRKKMFLSILCIQIFYYCILLSSFTSFSPLIIFLFIGLLNNGLALISIRNENVLGLSLYLFLEITMIGINYFIDLTTLFILRLILFMIAYKLRHSLIAARQERG